VTNLLRIVDRSSFKSPTHERRTSVWST